ncbi:unnamed protein product [Lymnaea stagnalis]|uniref:Uncharacterized protein n=1 Tax=Lymnaea stagnalis TaxID=6523 RepID=A0AAV2HNL6_LYMST
MSNSNNQTDLKRGEEDPFPIAAIVCLAVGGYVVIVIVIVIVRYMLVKQGVCKPQCCTSQSGSCCLVCTKLNEACPCCCSSNVDGCLSKICGKRKTTNCVDILLCNCCGCTEGCCDNCFEKYGRQSSSIPTSSIIP